MKVYWDNVRAFDTQIWPIVVEKLIKEEQGFPRVATVRQYLFAESEGRLRVDGYSPKTQAHVDAIFKQRWANMPPLTPSQLKYKQMLDDKIAANLNKGLPGLEGIEF